MYDHMNRSQNTHLSHSDIKSTLQELNAAKNDEQVRNIILTVTDKKSVKEISREEYLGYVDIE